MSETKKLSEKELTILREYQKQQNAITFDLGQVDIQKAFLEGSKIFNFRWFSRFTRKIK